MIFRFWRPVSCKNQENGWGKQWSLHSPFKFWRFDQGCPRFFFYFIIYFFKMSSAGTGEEFKTFCFVLKTVRMIWLRQLTLTVVGHLHFSFGEIFSQSKKNSLIFSLPQCAQLWKFPAVPLSTTITSSTVCHPPTPPPPQSARLASFPCPKSRLLVANPTELGLTLCPTVLCSTPVSRFSSFVKKALYPVSKAVIVLRVTKNPGI